MAKEIRSDVVLGLYEREGAMLYRLAFRVTGSREDARDAVQETFVKLVQQPDLDKLETPAAWLRTVVTRTAIDLRRKRNRDVERKREKALELLAADEGLTTSRDGAAAMERAEALQVVVAGLEQLSALDRAILLRRALEDVPLAVIAEGVGVTEKAARNRLSRARTFLRERLRKAERKT